MVCSPDGDTVFIILLQDFFRDIFVPFLFIICLDYVPPRKVLDKNLQLGFTLLERKSRCYPGEKITDADYAEDLVILADHLKDAMSLLHNIKNVTQEIGLYANAGKSLST